MKWKFTHPYREDLSINFGKLTQIIEENKQLKYYIWQILIWYFDGKKYSMEDLSLFEQNEPVIFSDESVLKRTDYKIISISDIQDLIEQMAYKKGTVSFDYLKSKLNDFEIMGLIDVINDKLDLISSSVNQRLNLHIGEVEYHTESQYFNPEQLIIKNFLPYFGLGDKNISFEFLENETKFFFFLDMISEVACQSSSKIILITHNMDSYLNYSEFINCCKKMNEMTMDLQNFHVINFLSSEGYIYINKENIMNVNIVADLVEHFYEFSFMYERFFGQYPANEVPDEKDFLESLQKVSSYLFSKDIAHISLSIPDIVTLKIINHLYQYDKKPRICSTMSNPLLIKFLNTYN